jgi:hypothetical protein
MWSNTGTASIVLYGIFMLIALGGSAVAIIIITRGKVDPVKMDKVIELAKYTIVSIAIATVTLIVSNLFKERDQDVKELEYFDKYVQDVKKVDGIEERYLLSKYLSIVAPSGELKKSWKEYHDTLTIEYNEYLHLKREKEKLDTVANPSQDQLMKKQRLTEIIELKEMPIVSSILYGNLTPRVYIHIANEEQRETAKTLQAILTNENFSVPGIENVGVKPNLFVPLRTEVRYYREEERADALRLLTIIKAQHSSLVVNETPQKIPGTGRGTRPGHFEIWFGTLSKKSGTSL